MAFVNEYAPTLDQEVSDFRDNARKTLKIGYSKFDRWTIDDERHMVLYDVPIRKDADSAKWDIWNFIWQNCICEIHTTKTFESEVSKDEILVAYEITGCREGSGYSRPDLTMLKLFKEALREYRRWHLFNPNNYTRCQLTLVDAKTGEEI